MLCFLVYRFLTSCPFKTSSRDSTFLLSESTGGTSHNQAASTTAIKLGENALVSSNVTKVSRRRDTVEVRVSTPTGIKLIRAVRLLIATPSNLGFLSLDYKESSIFGQFNYSYYWDAVMKGSGI